MMATAVEPEAEDRWVSPVRIDIGISVLDCSSRLLSTVRARCYDKIRRLVDTVPTRIRRFYKEAGYSIPTVSLHVRDLESLAIGFSASDILAMAESIQQAGLDSGADRVRLLEIDIAGGARQAQDLDMIPDLLNSCSESEIVLQLGSSEDGANARDLYATALTLLLDEFRSGIGSRLILGCNTHRLASPQSRALDGLLLDASVSVWPLLSEIRDELSSDACYTDKMVALGFVGEKAFAYGGRLVRDLNRTLNEASVASTDGSIRLSVNAPGEGPGPSGIWVGLPITSQADATPNRLAAMILRQGLTAKIGSQKSFTIESDGLPLSTSIRNIHAVSSDTSPATLAGYLVRTFSTAVENNECRCIRITSSTQSYSEQGIILHDIGGSIPFIPRDEYWTADHFINGGTILPPVAARS